MTVCGLASISNVISSEGYFVKCILNRDTAVFFPGNLQHRDIKQAGVSYEDDYKGNALAATVNPGRIDVRYHRDYPDALVQSIFKRLLECDGMQWASGFCVRYQGRRLIG